jgi:hypothetical protein
LIRTTVESVTGVDGRPLGTLGDVLTEHRRRRFVGRSAEIELFRAALDDAIGPPFSVLHVHGPGGVGKTGLLQVLGVVAAGAGATVARLDGRDLEPSPVSVLEALGETLAIPAGDGPIGLSEGGGRLVLLVDAYEQMSPLDHWFRARLIPRLPASAIIVIAGRDAPSRAWRTDPAWGALLRVVSLRKLSIDASRALLVKAGIDPHLHERMVRLTYGHPLGLALLTDVVARGGQVESDVLPLDLVEVLLQRFVETVPDSRHRRVLGACAVARCTTEALLRDVLEEGDVHDVFSWLRELSFIEPRPDGVAPHDLARDVLDADLRWRDFDRYKQVFRQVREHSLASARTTTGRAQQRAIFDLKFLFRQARIAMAPVEWVPGVSTTQNLPVLRTVGRFSSWFGPGRASSRPRSQRVGWTDSPGVSSSSAASTAGSAGCSRSWIWRGPSRRTSTPTRVRGLGLRARQLAAEARGGARTVPVRGRPEQLSRAFAHAECHPDPDPAEPVVHAEPVVGLPGLGRAGPVGRVLRRGRSPARRRR